MNHEVPAIPITVAVLFHSGFGHTARQAEAVRRGVERVAGASVLFLTSDEAQGRLDDLKIVDAIIFGAPTYMGSVSGRFKTFMDSTSKPYATGAWKDKIAAGFTNSGSKSGDKLATLTQFAIFAAQHRMHWVNLGLPSGNNSTYGSDHDLNRLGFWLGAAAQSNNDQGPDFAPPEIRSSDRRIPRRARGKSHAAICARSFARSRRLVARHPREHIMTEFGFVGFTGFIILRLQCSPLGT